MALSSFALTDLTLKSVLDNLVLEFFPHQNVFSLREQRLDTVLLILESELRLRRADSCSDSVSICHIKVGVSFPEVQTAPARCRPEI